MRKPAQFRAGFLIPCHKAEPASKSTRFPTKSSKSFPDETIVCYHGLVRRSLREQNRYGNTRSLSPPYRGLFCYQGFVFALFYMGANKGLSLGTFVLERADLLCTLLCALATLLAMIRFPQAANRVLESDAALATCAFMLMAGAFVPSFVIPSPLLGLVVEGLLVGVPMATLLGAWGRVLGLSSPAGGHLRDFRVVRRRWSRLLCGLRIRHRRVLAFNDRLSRCKRRHAPRHRRRTVFVFRRCFPPASHIGKRTDWRFASRPHALEANACRGASVRSLGGFHGGVSLHSGTLTTPTLPATLLILALFCIAVLQSLLTSKAHEKNPLGHTYRIVLLVTMARASSSPPSYRTAAFQVKPSCSPDSSVSRQPISPCS